MIILASDIGIGLIIAVLVIWFIIISIAFQIIQEGNEYVIERLGIYSRTLGAGIHFIVPFIDRVKSKVSLNEQVVDIASQDFTTKDNIIVQIDATVVFMVTDAKLYSYGAKSPRQAIENATTTILRSRMWDLKLEEAFASRNEINTKMTNKLDEATDSWGIKIVRVEVKNIIAPKDVF